MEIDKKRASLGNADITQRKSINAEINKLLVKQREANTNANRASRISQDKIGYLKTIQELEIESLENNKSMYEKLLDFQKEVKTATENLTTILEPILLVIVGIAVGFIATSVITPIYAIINQFNK